MAGDIYFNDVSLLLHCDGTNGSTTFTDSSNNALTVTPNGNAQISTAQSKFGGASGAFDGTGDYLSVTDANIALSSNDFTVEFFVYQPTIIANTGFFQIASSVFPESASGIAAGVSLTGGYLRWYYQNSPHDTTAILSNATFHHIAITRHGTDLRLFLDGVLVDSVTDSTNLSGTSLVVGGWYSSSFLLTGYIDEFRITNGIARYTSNFTPPTSAFPDYQPFISGTLTESLVATDFKARSYQLSDGALVGETTVNSSPYTLELQTLEPVLVTMLPDYGTQWTASTAYALNDKVFPTDPAASPYYYECTTAGTSDASEPTWPTSGTVNDGTAVWTYVEQMVQPITHGPLIPS